MRTRTALTAAALAAAATLTLTACGDSGDGGSDEIVGAGDGAESPSPSAAASDPADAPDVSLPDDVKLEFDWEAPSDAGEAAAMRDAENYVRSIYRAETEQSLEDPAYQFYSRDQALEYAREQIQKHLDAGLAPTGTEHYYRVETQQSGSSVGLSFCVNQAELYSKKVKTGKVFRTEPSDASYLFYQIAMTEFPGRQDVWQATNIEVEGEATQCKQ